MSILMHLPETAVYYLKQWKYAWQISNAVFTSPEPEFTALSYWLKPGQCAVDVGANVGHYTRRMADVVGPTGLVFAFEPIPLTYKLLRDNVRDLNNVVTYNSAVSNHNLGVTMQVPNGNYYRAAVVETGTALPSLLLDEVFSSTLEPRRVRLLKVDVEGHELSVLRGAKDLLLRDQPVLIVEGTDGHVERFLRPLGYRCFQLPQSPNRIFTPEHL